MCGECNWPLPEKISPNSSNLVSNHKTFVMADKFYFPDKTDDSHEEGIKHDEKEKN